MMKKTKIIGNPQIFEREIPDEGKYFQIIWEFEDVPSEVWVKEFDKEIKKSVEKENELFGPYKPQIFFNELVLTLVDKSRVKEQKKYYENEFLEKINSKEFG